MTISLTTETKPDGIHLTYSDTGVFFGRIANNRDQLAQWECVLSFGRKASFLSLQAAEYYALAFAIERRTKEEIARKEIARKISIGLAR